MTLDEARFSQDRLTRFAEELLQSAGARAEDAACVAAHLVGANLTGHESHGVGLLPAYVRHIRDKLVDCGADAGDLKETAILLQQDFGGGWGAPAAYSAIDRCADKAREHGLSALTIGNAHHLGRIGAYAEHLAAAGLVSMHFVNVTDHAPWSPPSGAVMRGSAPTRFVSACRPRGSARPSCSIWPPARSL